MGKKGGDKNPAGAEKNARVLEEVNELITVIIHERGDNHVCTKKNSRANGLF